MGYRVAVVGATGTVGREVLNMLAEREFPADQVIALASEKSLGAEVSFGEDEVLKVGDLDSYDFRGTQIALFATTAKVAAKHVERAAKAGAVAVDSSAHFRLDADVPLVVAEINPKALERYKKRHIVASPSAASLLLTMALKPLHDVSRVRRAVVSTYQAVSAVGREGMDELFNQTRAVYVNDPTTPEHFTKRIAFNVIPHIDDFMEDGTTREEWRMSVETRKILDPEIAVTATCVRVPVFIGDAEAISVEFEKPIDVAKARDVLRRSPGISVVDARVDEGYVSPDEAAGEDLIYISRVRRDTSVPHGLSLWAVADNLRRGVALNLVQIAELLVKDYL